MAETNGTKPSSPVPGAPPSAQPQSANSQPPSQQQIQPISNNPPLQTTQSASANQSQPPPSLQDTTSHPRPHDIRTIHLILASLGITAYQERVPLQLVDFAYRYTSSILSDAQHLQSEGYVTGLSTSTNNLPSTSSSSRNQAAGSGAQNPNGPDQVSLQAVRLATSSRLGYQFSSSLPKQALLELAEERNRVKLPDVSKETVFGVRLPHERFLCTGVDWGMLDKWEGEEVDGDGEGGDAKMEGLEKGQTSGSGLGEGQLDGAGEGIGEKEDEEMGEGDEDEDENDEEGFNAVFGSGAGGGDGDGDGDGDGGEGKENEDKMAEG